MKTYIITIMDNEKSVEAAERCAESVSTFNPILFPAVTPKDNPFQILEDRGITSKVFLETDAGYSYIEPTVSAFLSHYSLWEKCVELNEEVQIFEHDALCVGDLQEVIEYDKVISIGHPSYGKFNIPEQEGVVPLISKSYFPGAHAYRVKPAGARELIAAAKECARATDVFLSINTFPFLEEYYPWPVIADDRFTTLQRKQGCYAKHGYNEEYETIDSNLKRVFVTGCDNKTEWMLPWFLKNYLKHNTTPIVFADFGVSDEMRAWVYQVSEFADIITIPKQRMNGLFLKPLTLLSIEADEVCWLDTDMHILGDISGVFNYVEEGKLAMVQDKPWTARQGEMWHNSGLVAIKGKPPVLHQWAIDCRDKPSQGDQEVLHSYFVGNPLRRLQYIKDVPNIYNWLRIQLLDGQDNPNKLIMHWTGQKGKDTIRKLMYNE